MSISLNPTTLEKLDQFAARRRRLVLTRGICSALASFLFIMTLIALADWLWVLSDATRWTLSAIGYLAAAAIVWLTCLRWLVRIPSREELARCVEQAEPQLRENLLSAIELCAADPESLHDSPVFRQLLQNRVGRQMADVRVASLLPVRLIRRWLAASATIVTAFAVLLSLPGLPFRQLMTRAMLPGANLDRISRIHVAILQPMPHSLTLPRNETVAVVVEVSGGDVEEAILETDSAAAGAVRQPMRPRGPKQFVSNLTIEEEAIEYRILAGDAVTRKYTIRSRPRPSVLSFHKTYRFPEYSGLPDRSVVETSGDLVALEGSKADVVFELDQDAAEAELRVERSDSNETATVPLRAESRRRWHASLPIDKPGVYRVRLVASETGFENIFSPKHEIRPEPDLIPRAGFVGIDDTTLLLPPNDILALKGMAEDDLPLVGLEQYVSVNGRPWEKTTLPIEKQTRVAANWDWDMIGLKLVSGDQVTTKLVATDRKGNLGESVPLQIVIASPDFDPNRHAAMELKAGLGESLSTLATTVEEHRTAAGAILERLRKESATALTEADATVLMDLARKTRDEADKARQQTLEVLPKMPGGADAYEVELAARVLARIQYASMRSAALDIRLAGQPAAPAPAEDLKRLDETFKQAAEDARRLRDGFRRLLVHNVLAAIAADFNALLEHQRQLLAPQVPVSWQRMLRQETVAVNQLRVIEKLILAQTPRLPESTSEGLARHLQWVVDRRERLESRMESEDQLRGLQEAARSLTAELPGQQQVATLDGRLPSALVEARRDLAALGGSLFDPMARLADSASKLSEATRRAGESKDSEQAARSQADAKQASVQIERFLGDSSDRLGQWRATSQGSPDADPQYAADAGLTRRALDAQLHRFTRAVADETEVPGIVSRIAPAYRILEAGHGLVHLDMCFDQLLSRERFESQRLAARLDHPRQWDAVQSELELVAKALRDAGFSNEIAARVDRLRYSPPAQQAAEKITSRRWRYENYVSAGYELLEIAKELDAALDEARPIMAEARALIAQYAPTLPEMAEQAAEDLRKFEAETGTVADALPDSSRRIDDLQQTQDQVNQQLGDLLDALVEDAGAQDMMTEAGRERARDADDSMAMIQEPAGQMNRAMDRAASDEQTADQARDLAQAEEHQEKTADVLDQIAEHYGRLEKGEDVADTRSRLRQAEQEMGIARQMDERYAEAEKLAEMAAKSPQDLLAELEAELQRNPAMRDALSEISQDALQQAKNSLENSANREAEMERSLERSDREFQEKKNEAVRELREIGAQASELASRDASRAASAASQAQTPDARQGIAQAQQDLNQASSQARSVSEDTAYREVLDAAKETAAALEKAAKELSTSRDQADKAKDKPIDDSKERQSQRQRELQEEQQRNYQQVRRELDEGMRRAQQVARERASDVQRAERNLRTAEKELDRTRQALSRSSNKESAQRNANEAEAQRQTAQRQLERGQKALASATERQKAAAEAIKQHDAKKPEALQSPNPAAELASRLAGQAATAAEQLAERARELAQQPEWAGKFSPSQSALNQASEQQENVGEDVGNAGEDVARAGRHEKRLGKPALAEQLAEAADNIEGVKEGEVAESQEKLQEAAEKPEPAKAGPASAPSPGNPQALAAQASIPPAEDALRQQAEDLGEILSPKDEAPAADQADLAAAEDMQGAKGQPQSGQPQSGQPQSGQAQAGQAQSGQPQSGQAQAGQPQSGQPSGEPTPEETARGQMLARTLDDLDRAMANSTPNSMPAGALQRGLPTMAQAAQAQAAQMAGARLQARAAAQAQGQPQAKEPAQGAALVDKGLPVSELAPVARNDGEDWGKLRSQSADDVVSGRKESIAAEYRKQVETYFRVIAERAGKKP